MGAWFICRNGEPTETMAKLAAAKAQFRAHGLPEPVDFATATHSGFMAQSVNPGFDTFYRAGDDFIAVAGTLFYKGQAGEPALKALLADFTVPFDRWRDCIGQFGLLVRKNGRFYVTTDYFGAFQVFHDANRDVVATTMMSVVATFPKVSFSTQGVYEFVFSSFPMGDETVFNEVKRLGPLEQLEMGEVLRFHPVAKRLPGDSDTRPLDEMVRHHAEALQNLAAVPARLFGDNIQCPLSSGFDSRMALAMLREQGVKPHVYVYGAPGDSDVETAIAIGKGEGFDVEVFQKPRWQSITPEEYPEIVARNFDETDALVTDGGLFDNGGNRRARLDRQLNGALAVSGGCGEVYRNFFYLPNRSFRVRDILHAFFSQFDPQDCTDAFDTERYYQVLGSKMKAALMTDQERLSRSQVEAAYPLFRCRPFFGREISLVGRHGAYFMPFLEPGIVRDAVRLPLRYKSVGQFQSKLITAISPRLARYTSGYGHPFDQSPNLSHRFSDFSGIVRPPWLRRLSYPVKRRLSMVADDHGGLLSPEYLGTVVDLQFPFMRQYFRVDQMSDQGMRRRIANLEYLAVRLGSQLNTETTPMLRAA